ncbi:MAG: zinc-dependent metalloprotease [Bacteroidales bacterium]
MNKYFTVLLLAGCALAPISATAQDCNCGFDHQHELMMRNPETRKSFEKTQSYVKRIQRSEFHEGTYVIPIVFHVFGETFNNGSTLTLDKIKEAIAKTNSDFQGKNADWNATGPSSRFEELKKPLNIEFRLAQINPDGQPCTGVNFYPAKSGFGNGGGYDEEIARYAWDNEMYMNVYIMRDLYADGDYYNSGVAWLPDAGMTTRNTARVVYNGSYIGRNTDENFRRVLTHEFGHFFGLHHTFNGGCSYPNDGVADTPPVAKSKWPKDDVNCEGNYTDWQNFMNYTDAYLHYTIGQVELMEQYLNAYPRKTLWQQANLEATGVNDGYEAPAAVISTGNLFDETAKNNGSIEGRLKFDAANGLLFTKTGTLEAGTDFVINNLPEGLTANVVIENNTTGSLVLTGNALAHTPAENISKQTFTLKGNILSDGKDADMTYSISFLSPYTKLCKFSPRFSQCAFISKVEFSNIQLTAGFDGEQWTDYINDYVAGLEAGKTYEMKVGVTNWSSGENDPYGLRLWVDWNGDFILDPSEYINFRKIQKIGAPGNETEVIFDVDVPADITPDKKFSLRIMLHYYQGNEGADPCGIIDSGDVKDFGAIIGKGENPEVKPEERPDEICKPDISYRPYALISKVELNGMVNESVKEGANVFEDFRKNPDLLIKLQKGNTYTAKVTYMNVDSSKDDYYRLRLYFDWDNSNTFSKEECQRIDIPKIGTGEITREFEVLVPEDAVTSEPITMRAFLHYGKGMAGELPCGTVENGQVEDYLVQVNNSGGNSLSIIGTTSFKVYPSPTTGIVNVITESPVTGYELCSLEGRTIRKATQSEPRIDISGTTPGMYLLKIYTQQGVEQTTIIVQ